jgi:hypothetical protein
MQATVAASERRLAHLVVLPTNAAMQRVPSSSTPSGAR